MKASPTANAAEDHSDYLRLFVLSLFVLFLEVLMIRWLATEIRVFAYFSNLTLIACFLGIGGGCLLCSWKRPAFIWTFPLLALFCLIVMVPEDVGYDIYGPVTSFLGDFNDMPLWMWESTQGKSVLPRIGALLLLVLLFTLVVGLFVPGGRLMGLLFDRCENKLKAYSVNLLGSLAGVWLFALLSALSLSPPLWFGVACLLGLPLVRRKSELAIALACTPLVLAPFILDGHMNGNVTWSPYQKLCLREVAEKRSDGSSVRAGFQINVNETFYQRLLNLSPAFLRQHTDIWPDAHNTDYLGYNLVYRMIPSPKNVLVVGAGTGNDTAAALRNGAGHVDAVEIDPVIVHIGRKFHPEKPYTSPRVSVFVDDARSFFKKTDRKYDLIWFGALDSHTLTSSFSNIRIDNYVYTLESFREARNLLTEDGVLALTFATERAFIGVRLRAMLSEAFQTPVCAFFNPEIGCLNGAGGGPTFLVAKDGRVMDRVASDPRVAAIVEEKTLKYWGSTPLSTDDWPYLYLQSRTIPRLYFIVMAIIVILALLASRPVVGDLRTLDWPFFALGAAFLLIEVQSISKMAMLFGSTWTVNTVVISAVLATILLANVIVALHPQKTLKGIYVGLFAALLVNLLFPFRTLLFLPPAVKGLVAGSIMALPILFAGIIFATLFPRSKNPVKSLGANILGAIAGGACQTLSFVIGINALGWIAMAFYAGALLGFRRRRTAEPPY